MKILSALILLLNMATAMEASNPMSDDEQQYKVYYCPSAVDMAALQKTITQDKSHQRIMSNDLSFMFFHQHSKKITKLRSVSGSKFGSDKLRIICNYDTENSILPVVATLSTSQVPDPLRCNVRIDAERDTDFRQECNDNPENCRIICSKPNQLHSLREQAALRIRPNKRLYGNDEHLRQRLPQDIHGPLGVAQPSQPTELIKPD